MGLYPGIMIPPAEQIKKYSISSFFGFGSILTFVLVSSLTDSDPAAIIKSYSENTQVTLAFFMTFIFSILLLPIFRELAKRKFSHFKWWGVPAVIYCTNTSADIVIEKLNKNKYLGYKAAVIIDAGLTEPTMKKYGVDRLKTAVNASPNNWS